MKAFLILALAAVAMAAPQGYGVSVVDNNNPGGVNVVDNSNPGAVHVVDRPMAGGVNIVWTNPNPGNVNVVDNNPGHVNIIEDPAFSQPSVDPAFYVPSRPFPSGQGEPISIGPAFVDRPVKPSYEGKPWLRSN